jgi:aspartate/methionine/tyrosine aminotransferase
MPATEAAIQNRVSLLKPTAVNSILAEVRRRTAQGHTVVSLMRGEPDLPTPEHIVEAAERALRAGRTRYSDNRGEPVLREAVAAKLAVVNSLEYNPATEILVTDGATMGLWTALMALVGPGDEVLVPDPIYDAYYSPIRLAGASPKPVASVRRNGRFTLTVDALETAVTPATRLLLLNTPWNPVGTVLTRSELAEIGEFVCRRDLTLISDEIYETITYDPFRHVSPASLSNDLKKRCVVVNSLSKTYAMTGWRLGYCAAAPELIQAMLLVLQQASRGPAMFVQDAGVAALTGPQECVRHMQQEYAARRRAVIESLAGLSTAEVLLPEGGFFAMVDISRAGKPSDDVRQHLLNEHGVVVAHGRAYGEAGEGTLRVSFASGGDTLARGLALLRQGLGRL